MCYVDSHHNVFGMRCNVVPLSVSYGHNLYSDEDNLSFNAEGMLR